MADTPLTMDNDAWLNRDKGQHAAFQAFEQASLAKAIRKQQEFDRRFHTPKAREEALGVSADIETLHEKNDEELKAKVQAIADHHDWNYQSPEFNRDQNELRAKAYDDWRKQRAHLNETEEQLHTGIEMRQVKLDHPIGPKGPERQIEDQRSDHKKAWDDAGARPQQTPKRTEIHTFNAISSGAPL